MDFIGSLAALNTALQSLKNLQDIKELASSSEVRLQIADIRLALSEARSALSEARDQITALEKEKADREKTESAIDELTRDGVLFRDQKTNLYKCPTCIEQSRKIITVSPGSIDNPYSFTCNVCKYEFLNPKYVDESINYSFTRREGLV